MTTKLNTTDTHYTWELARLDANGEPISREILPSLYTYGDEPGLYAALHGETFNGDRYVLTLVREVWNHLNHTLKESHAVFGENHATAFDDGSPVPDDRMTEYFHAIAEVAS